MKKIAVISDIHGNIAALEKVVEDIKTRKVDFVINLGDHVSGPLWAKETIQFLMKQDWVTIRGNHDRQLVTQHPAQHGLSDRVAFRALNDVELEWLKQLPAQAELQDGFLLTHGTPQSDTTYLLETVEHGRGRLATPEEITQRLGKPKPGIILCGHTHIPRVVNLSDEVMLVNPGSVGLQAYDDTSPEYHIMETGSPHARYAILENSNHHWHTELIAVAYDHQTASEQARKNRRPDWGYALQTGYMPSKNSG